jgi:hypothetical protein
MTKLLLAGCIAFKDYFANKNTFICLFMLIYNLILITESSNLLFTKKPSWQTLSIFTKELKSLNNFSLLILL